MCKKLFCLVLVLSLVGIASAQLPPGWDNQDINTTGGSASESGGTWTIIGDGADIWDSSDAFHYVFTQITGDGEIVARVVDNGTGTNDWAKGGVMIRETLEPGSKFAAVYMSTSANGVRFQKRAQSDSGATSDTDVATDEQKTTVEPVWLKLERNGNEFNAYYTTDLESVPWISMSWNPRTVEMADTVYIGLAVTSHADGELRTFTFDNISPQFLTPPGSPTNPSPANETTDVPRDVVLSWTPGEFAAPTNGHKVYLGESFNDVNNATGDVVQTAADYAPAQRLDFNTTYYWRIDEVNAPPTGNVEFKGDVWSFTTEPVAYPIEDVNATASSALSVDMGPENTVNGSGLVADDLHSAEQADMWISGSEPNGAWIEFEFDRVYKLHEILVWNSNQAIESIVGFGCKGVTIEYSADGNDYTTLGTTHEFARAPGAPGYAHNTTIDFGGVAAKNVRLTITSNWGQFPQYSLSEVRFMYIPVLARKPQPESGATDVDVDAVLSFRAGREAAEHNVYIDTDEQAVIDSNVPVTTVTEASHGPLLLDLGRTYYWKVNEVNDTETPTMLEGDIWNFRTQEYFVVDGFEDYNDYPGDRIYETWADGWEIPMNGALLGYPEPLNFPAGEHILETTDVHGGEQSLPFFYDNSTAASSEASVNIADLPIGSDWTGNGVKSLSLWFSGDPNNTAEQMYVKLNGVKVLYDSDAGNLSKAGWQPWNINLTDFTGVNLSNVTELSIGFSGGSGMVLFDDIRLYPYERQLVTPTEPNTVGLVGHWQFDGNFSDSSGNGRNGTPVGAVSFETDPVIGQVLSLPGGDDQFVDIDSVGIDGNMPRTIACWAKADNTDIPDWTLIFGFTGDVTGGGGNGSHFNIGSLGGPGGVGAHCWGWEETIFSDEAALDWHHYAMTYDGTTIQYYGDGILMDTDTGKSNVRDISASADRVHVGSRITQTSSFPGKVDDAQIFNRVLSDAEIAWLGGVIKPFDKPF